MGRITGALYNCMLCTTACNGLRWLLETKLKKVLYILTGVLNHSVYIELIPFTGLRISELEIK